MLWRVLSQEPSATNSARRVRRAPILTELRSDLGSLGGESPPQCSSRALPVRNASWRCREQLLIRRSRAGASQHRIFLERAVNAVPAINDGTQAAAPRRPSVRHAAADCFEVVRNGSA